MKSLVVRFNDRSHARRGGAGDPIRAQGCPIIDRALGD
jgi:hypothetical protein